MKTLKKTISIFLVLAMLFAFVPSALASNSPEYAAAGTVAADQLAAITNFDDVKTHFGIVDSTVTDAKMTSTNDGNSIKNITIDFEKETIYWDVSGSAPTVDPAYVSFNKGEKWAAMKFSIGDSSTDGADFSKFLDKESTIWITTALDPKTKQPQKKVEQKLDNDGNEIVAAVDAAITWKFGKIDARPKLDKFTVDYSKYAVLGKNGKWTLKKSGTQTIDGLQVAYSTDKGKTAVDNTYGSFPADNSPTTEPALNVVEGSKPGEKLSFLVRVAPTPTSAGSKPKKYSISTLTKAPTLKIDYKKNVIAAKAGTIVGDATAAQATPDDPWVFTKFTDPQGGAEDGKGKLNETDIVFKAYTKESKEVKPGIPITPHASNPVHYAAQIAATEKKPASMIQLLTVMPATAVYEVDALPTVKGASVKLPKGYEACLIKDAGKAETKWKSSIKTDKNNTYAVRLKNTAKYKANDNSTTGSVTSGNLILDVATGKDAKGKVIITAAVYLSSITSPINVTTASAATDAVYPPSAAATFINAKLADNALPADIKTGTMVLQGSASHLGKTDGLKGLFAKASDASALNELAGVEVKGEDKVLVVTADYLATGMGTFTYTIECDAQLAPEAKDKFYAPVWTVNVTDFKESTDCVVSKTATAAHTGIEITIPSGTIFDITKVGNINDCVSISVVDANGAAVSATVTDNSSAVNKVALTFGGTSIAEDYVVTVTIKAGALIGKPISTIADGSVTWVGPT